MITRDKNTSIEIKLKGWTPLNQWESHAKQNGQVAVSGFYYYSRPNWPVSWYQTVPTGWGCGVTSVLGSMEMFLQPELWEEKEFVEAFRQFYLSGNVVICITDMQLEKAEKDGVIKKLSDLFILHNVGSFPNYVHGPNNMNILMLCLFEQRKKEFPVKWDKLNSRKNAVIQEKQNVQETIVGGSPITTQRDARGRFSKGLSTSAVNGADWASGGTDKQFL